MSVVQLMTYEQWQDEHKKLNSKVKKARAKERRYYLRQKLFALLVCLFGLVIVAIGEGAAWANLKFMGDVIILVSIYVAVTQKKIIV